MSVDVPDWSSVALVSAPAQVLGQITAVAGGTTIGGSLPLPSGSQAVGVAAYVSGSNRTPASFTVIGNVTGIVYPLAVWQKAGPQWTQLAPSDTAVSLTLTASVSNPATMDVLVSPLLPAVQTPAIRPQVVLGFTVTLVAGATATIIAAVSGEMIYLFGLRYSHQALAATGGQFQDSSGNPIDFWDQTNMLTPGPVELGGAPMGQAGSPALQVKNTGGVNMHTLLGTVSHFQG